MVSDNGHDPSVMTGTDPRSVLRPVAETLQADGFYAYLTLDQDNQWMVACDTEEGHVDVRVGNDGFVLDVWDTSPGLFWEEEDERRRTAKERLARVSLPAIARGYLEPNQEIWWDEDDHGVGARVRAPIPFAVQRQIGMVARERLAELNHVIALVEARLFD